MPKLVIMCILVSLLWIVPLSSVLNSTGAGSFAFGRDVFEIDAFQRDAFQIDAFQRDTGIEYFSFDFLIAQVQAYSRIEGNFLQKLANSDFMHFVTRSISKAYTNITDLIQDSIRSLIYQEPYKTKIIFLICCSMLLFIMFLLSFIGKIRMEKGLYKEYGKIDKRVAERTKKIKLENESLRLDLNQIITREKELFRVKEAVETMLIGVTITDIFGKILYVNPADAKMHGYEQDELIGRYISIFTSDVLRSELELENIDEWHGIVRHSSNVRKDGSVFSVQLISNVVRDGKDNPMAIVTTFEDISERSKAEQALKKSEESFRRIFENIQDIYYEVDIDGIIKEISPSVRTISDFQPKDLIGKSMLELYGSVQQRDNLMYALNREDTVNDYEISVKGKGGVEIPCSVTAKLMLDENMLPSRIVGSMRNITRRKIAEEKQKQILDDLQFANKDLRDFAYSTSHDLKSPLRAISTLASWINSDYADKFDETGKEQMQLLIGRVERMNQLIEGLFQYSSLGSFKGERVNIETGNLVLKIIGKLKPPTEIKFNLDENLPAVVFEKHRIEQVFHNLIHNAITYMGAEKGQISIGYQLKDKFHEFRVSDTGVGIAEKYYDKIFQIFQTLQSRDEMETAGIGLALTKKIIEMNNGKIWVESELDKGSTFYFTIPV